MIDPLSLRSLGGEERCYPRGCIWGGGGWGVVSLNAPFSDV